MASNYIVLTHPRGEDTHLKEEIERLGFQTLTYPTITITRSPITPHMKQQLQNIHEFDWIIFTSKHGVHFLIEILQELKIDTSVLQTKKIGVVGVSTQKVVESYGISVIFIPSKFTTEVLGKEITPIYGEKILLPRSNIANQHLIHILEEKGAQVTNIPIYTTDYVYRENTEFVSLVMAKKIQMVIFTSPSTIKGFVKSIPKTVFKKILDIPILSIGPVTSQAAMERGFTQVHTSDEHTTNGILLKLKESSIYYNV